jgi:hypothetical protein
LKKVDEAAETCSKGTSCVQENDIQTKLNALFATRQKHGAGVTVIGTSSSRAGVNANASTNGDCNASSSGIVLDWNDRSNVTDTKADFKFKLNAVFSQRIPSKAAGENDQEIRGNTGNTLDKNQNTIEDDLLSMKQNVKEHSRIVSHGTNTCGIDCRNDVDAVQDVHEDVRDSEPQSVNCEKYLKMLKLRLPEAAVKHAMIKDGVDPSLLFADNAVHKRPSHSDSLKKKDQFRRIRLHWDTIPEESVSQGCIWHEIALDSDVGKSNKCCMRRRIYDCVITHVLMWFDFG